MLTLGIQGHFKLGDLSLHFNILKDQKNMTISDTEMHLIKSSIYSY